MNFIKNHYKKIISWLFTGIIAIQALLSTFSVAFGAMSNYGQLGTNTALGSPILDQTFVLEDWNKWEMICWGVFLSNFCTPLVDDYNSAFNSNATNGSKGAGYKALAFGSGSDPANAETIQGLLNAAITQQGSGNLKPMYVTYNDISIGLIEKKEIPKGEEYISGDDTSSEPSSSSSSEGTAEDDNDDDDESTDKDEDDDDDNLEDASGVGDVTQTIGEFRPAKFRDMFLATDKDDNDTWAEVKDSEGMFSPGLKRMRMEDIGYIDIASIEKGSIPTFTIKSGTGYEVVFDYTDSWDVQLMTAWVARTCCGDYAEEFSKVFKSLWETNPDISMDCFANIVVPYNGTYRIVMPSAANQHITVNPTLNLITSLIFNGYNSNLSATELVLNGQQNVSGGHLWWGDEVRFSGLPAFGSHLSSIQPGTILMYYDLDTVLYQDAMSGGNGQLSSNWVISQGWGTHSTSGTEAAHYGKELARLFELDITGKNNKYPLKIESANMDQGFFSPFEGVSRTVLETMVKGSGQLANMSLSGSNAKILHTLKTPQGDLSLIDSPVIVPVQMWAGREKKGTGEVNSAGAARIFMNYVYEAYRSGKKSTATEISSKTIKNAFGMEEAETVSGLKEIMLGTNNKKFLLDSFSSSGKVSPLLASFIADKQDLYKLNVPASNLISANYTWRFAGDTNAFDNITEIKIDGKNVATALFKDNKSNLKNFPGRCVKAYPLSEVMRATGNVLGLREGTEFSLYSMYIYMTYLDWYGITTKTTPSGREVASNFNPRIFDAKDDVLNIDISSIANLKSEEDKKKEVLNYTYMMLHPTEGRQYRNDLLMGALSDWIYETYQRIVYGGASESYSSLSSNLATRNAAGFLNIESYSDNFMTAWLMKIYPTVVVWVLGISLIIIVIMGLLKGRKLSWFLLSFVIIINTIVLVPSFGEITPYVANNMVQGMFTDKMTYWGISEAVTNATMEADYVNNTTISTGYLSGLSKKEQAQVVQLVKTFNVCYLDRSLMLKNDISKKITQAQSGGYAEIQELQSARWMLPMIMRQFSANDSSANYVYVPLGDMYDNLSNMYWYYKPEDALNSGTVAGQQKFQSDGENPTENSDDTATKGEMLSASDRVQYYPDYKNIETNKTSDENTNYKSIALDKGLDNLPHTFFYLLRTSPSATGGAKAVPLPRNTGFGGEYTSLASFEKYIKTSVENTTQITNFKGVSDIIESESSTYDIFNRSTVHPSFGYLWATENPYHYFYQATKDSFDSYTVKGTATKNGEDMDDSESNKESSSGDKTSELKGANGTSLGSVVGQLQGSYVKPEGSSDEVRKSFMHMGETGKIRDIVNLEEMFTNMIPYLYEMQITTGGTNGITGVFGSEKVTEVNNKTYKNNYKSWFFRSNWVTKIMENPQYTKSAIVKDKSGATIEIKNPTLIDCYPQNRPMIFSEAQMYVEGLTEADLNIVELKCIETNKNISRRWTMLLNYANVQGMTKEVLFRQMATEATLEFDKTFSPNGVMSGAYAMYPQGLDLRAISFDSVMKMLMLNVTRDTSYIYGDTMKGIVEDSDIFTALLLLSSAFLCAYIIPLIRNVTMGLIFYLGFVAIVYSLLASHKQKAKLSIGYLMSNIIFLAMTLMYYTIFSTLMAVTASDSVLTVQSVQVSVGNPVWCFIAILLASIVYIIAMCKMINFCFKHYRDMGFEVYASVAALAAESLSNGISSLGEKLTGSDGDSTGSLKGSGRRKKSTNVNVDGGEVDVDVNRDNQKPKSSQTSTNPEYEQSSYAYNRGISEDFNDPSDVNEAIERGKSKGDS